MTLVSRAEAIAGRVTRIIESGSPFWWVAIPLLAIYLLTPSANPHIDAFTNAITGWHIGMTGSAILPGYGEATLPENRRNVTWIEESPRGPVSQYPLGAAALSAPFYRLLSDDLQMVEVTGTNRPNVAPIVLGVPPMGPARLTAALSTAAAMGFVALSIAVAGGTKLGAVVAGMVGGLATSMWAVASSELWQHGPASMWVALAIYLVAKDRLLWGGIAFGAAIITRPHLAVIAAVTGVFVAASRRDWRPLLHVGLGSMVGLGGLLWFNWWVWGRLTVLGGYGPGMVDRLVSLNLMGYLGNMAGAMVDPTRGLLMISPFLAVLLPGLRAAWLRATAWAKGASVGSVVYLMVQLKANRYTGGAGFTGYRYPLEALTAGGVLLYLAFRHWVSQRRLVVALFWAGVAVATMIQMRGLIGAV